MEALRKSPIGRDFALVSTYLHFRNFDYVADMMDFCT
jgi:hypothetical protein